MRTSEFDYELPDKLIAQTPTEPRDAARLLRASDLSDWSVRDLPRLLDPGDVVVINDTRVRAARLRGHRRHSGGAVELLLLGRRGKHWEALVRPARRLRAGAIIDFGRMSARLQTDPVDGLVEVTLETSEDCVEDVVAAVGEVPLPPYIHEPLSDPQRYQTVFARRVGSAAAPTAALHFTQDTFGALEASGVEVATIELQVGLDTFRPITVEKIAGHQMHSEWISVQAEAAGRIRAARERGGRVVAIGTTVVRALETAAANGELSPFEGPTRLYIMPGYRFRVVDLLMTNFHIPSSSLLVLVAAFVGESWRDVYRAAIERNYRFLSFGDASIFDRHQGVSRA